MNTQIGSRASALLVLFLLSGVLVACGQGLPFPGQSQTQGGPSPTEAPAAPAQTAAQALEGQNWRLTAYRDAAGAQATPPADAEATLELNGGQLSGRSGCNQFGGSYTLDGGVLAIQPGPATLMACPEPLMALERDYFAALGNVAGYSLSGAMLELKNAAGETLLSFAPVEPAALTGTTWLLTAYSEGAGLVAASSNAEVTAVFGEDGQLAGSASCNNYTTSYQLDGESITLGAVATTRRACADPTLAQQELAYLDALQRSTGYEISGDQLTLLDAEGLRTATFIARGPAATAGP